MNIALRLAVFLLCAAALEAEAQGPPCSSQVSHIVMQTGSYSSQPGVTFDLRHFVATLVPQGNKAPACYAKVTVVSRADIFVSNESLTQVFAEKLGHTESKIKDLKIENAVGKVTLSGSIRKVIPIQFLISGPVTTDGTALLLDANQIKADGIPVKALMTLVGEDLGSMLGLKGVNGITVQDNRMSFFPEQIAHLKGHISSVETTQEGLILRYGRTSGGRVAAHPVVFRESARPHSGLRADGEVLRRQ